MVSDLHALKLTNVHLLIHPEAIEVRAPRNSVFDPTGGGTARNSRTRIFQNEHGAMNLDIRMQVRRAVKVDRYSKNYSEPKEDLDQKESVITNGDTISTEGR